MFRNYLRTAVRFFLKNKSYSFLNIAGLAIGIACAGLIFIWVEDELQYNGVHENRDRLYVVKMNSKTDNGVFTHTSTPGPLAASLKGGFQGVEKTCRVSEEDKPVLLRNADKSIYASGMYAEPAVFDLFTFDFVEGNAAAAFREPYSMVVSSTTAEKIFGKGQSAVGKVLRADNKQDYVVTGVVKDPPANSSFKFDWLAPFDLYYRKNEDWLSKWNNYGLTTYVELQPGADVTVINKQLSEPRYDFTLGKIDATPSSDHIYLFGMKYWRLYGKFLNGVPSGSGRIQYVHLFSVIAWIILFIACINFMNLATARSSKRSREVGVRKVLGAGKAGLRAQFIGEAMLMALMAMITAVLIMSLVLPAFNILVSKQLVLALNKPLHWGALLTLTLLCGLVAGSYPSFYLSSFNPIYVLKGQKTKDGGAVMIRRGLVVLQFSISILLIIGTLVVYRQIQHVKDRDLGFNRDHLLQVTLRGDMLPAFSLMRQELMNTGSVENAALADHPTINDGNNTSSVKWQGKDPNSHVTISQRLVSPEFMKTMGMHIREGRDFGETDVAELTDKGAPKEPGHIFQVIITASLAKLMGEGSAVGKMLEVGTDEPVLHMQVAGVIDDYVYGSVYETKSAPVIFYCIPGLSGWMYVRTKPGQEPSAALTKMENVIKKYSPGYPFEYRFVDDQFNARFSSEQLVSRLSRVFAALAIFISC
ncbi:MAG: ABC transporter permease, partial [Bacteroidetes bacterium]|nr:ABC transporter permease [Bacteroidota bacterium]